MLVKLVCCWGFGGCNISTRIKLFHCFNKNRPLYLMEIALNVNVHCNFYPTHQPPTFIINNDYKTAKLATVYVCICHTGSVNACTYP